MSLWGRCRQKTQFLCASICHSDGKHVVFGKVVDGMDVLKKMEDQGSRPGQTKTPVVLAGCRQL